MKTICLILALLAGSVWAKAQNPLPLESIPYIEVTGEGHIDVVPDLIYLQFTLTERVEGRTKTDLDKLEGQLKKRLSAEGFDLKNLSVSDANSDYVVVKRKSKDVLASKNYELKISTGDELSRVWNILDELKAENASIDRVDHSRIDELKKEVKIMAMKNAKEKADYLLEAIGEKTGRVLVVNEQSGYTAPWERKLMLVARDQAEASSPEETTLNFQKIKLTCNLSARFAIAP